MLWQKKIRKLMVMINIEIQNSNTITYDLHKNNIDENSSIIDLISSTRE